MKRPARRLATVVAVLAALGVLAANAVVLCGDHGFTQDPAAPPVDCALVLGAGVRDDGTPSDVLRDRLDQALALHRAGSAPRILVSGDHARAAYDEPNVMRAYLEARGVPRSAIFMDHAGLDTYSSVWRARHVFGATRVVIVTQRFHLARALWLARAVGLEAEGSAADRHRYRAAVWLETREVASRTKAVLDVAARRRPRHVGPPIPLGGDARATAG